MFTMNFKKRFAPDVESGRKRQTIRTLRKDGKRPAVGDQLRHYTGMRTKGCRRLMDTTCTKVLPVQIFDDVSGIAVVVGGRKTLTYYAQVKRSAAELLILSSGLVPPEMLLTAQQQAA